MKSRTAEETAARVTREAAENAWAAYESALMSDVGADSDDKASAAAVDKAWTAWQTAEKAASEAAKTNMRRIVATMNKYC